ncbi:MAG: LacI family DNA-binding transcriptional regulator [Planctomycetota bacterium]
MTNKTLPRLKDVANEANVSLSAASRILRGDSERFGKDTCKRVVAAAQKLGWRRNLLVSGMQSGRTNTIGVMIPPYDSFWTAVLSGIHETLSEADCLPITVWIGDAQAFPELDQPNEVGIKQISRLLDRRVDGLILWPPFGTAYYRHFREFVERKLPVAVIDFESSDDEIADSIETDEQQGASIVASHLLDLGHRRIACFSTAETTWQPWAVRRREHFEKAVTDGGAECKSWRSGPDQAKAVAIAKEMLTEYQPTAVFSITDHEAMPVYEACRQLGMSIPDDLSIIGFADLDFAAALTPPLTTVRQKPWQKGVQAAQLVLDRINGKLKSKKAVTIRVDTELVVRGSTTRNGAS